MQWRATGVYGYPKHHLKYLTCDLLKHLNNSTSLNKNWLLFGDLNITLSDKEKFGGNPIDTNITNLFRSTLAICDFQDLGYKGDVFTWNNRQQGSNLIKARLDRFVANTDWISLFPNYSNSHLLRYKSDHAPILLDFSPYAGHKQRQKRNTPIRYEQIWSRDTNHIQIVKDHWLANGGPTHQKLTTALNALQSWGKNRFGIIPTRIKNLQEELKKLNDENGALNLTEQIKSKELELDDILECEEMWWGQRSRALWLEHGDKNTKYFHMKANIRKKKNTIEAIKDSQGQIQHEDNMIEQILVEHFQTLFTKQNTKNITETVKVVEGKVSPEMHQMLSEAYTKEEVFQAIKDMKALAAPRPDGLPALFYHNYWDIIGNDITSMVLQVLNNNGDPCQFNSTHICLIPKTSHPSTPSDFRPISLCNVTLKIITKTLANRIKTILPKIISPNQSAFI
ncbi:hypothetical protein L195_g010693 [Trifolium pratense]|uniref:Uncharacterized protein n=1 Tax=Trifolium pratense TaxID=57577 RepID=A0A2K3PFL6_TRIPR|nr:hypothetical protein L195_g010693 [Trifolium pratense]